MDAQMIKWVKIARKKVQQKNSNKSCEMVVVIKKWQKRKDFSFQLYSFMLHQTMYPFVQARLLSPLFKRHFRKTLRLISDRGLY